MSLSGGPDQIIACANGAFEINLDLQGGDGPRSIVLTQTIGNRTYQDSFSVTKDSVAPVVILSQTLRVANGLQISGTCDTASAASVSVSGDLTAITLPCANNVFSGEVRLLPGDGQKRIEVSQRDLASNVGLASGSFLLDTQAPRVSITAPAVGSNITDSFQLTGTCETGLDVLVSGAGVQAQITAPCSN